MINWLDKYLTFNLDWLPNHLRCQTSTSTSKSTLLIQKNINIRHVFPSCSKYTREVSCYKWNWNLAKTLLIWLLLLLFLFANKDITFDYDLCNMWQRKLAKIWSNVIIYLRQCNNKCWSYTLGINTGRNILGIWVEPQFMKL